MTIFITWLNNPALLVALLLTGLVTDLIILGRQFGFTKSDWGTWIGSIGTVATLIGTIVLATHSRREAKRQAHDRAVVAAAGLAPRLRLIAESLQNAIETLLDFSTERSAVEYTSHANLIEKTGSWSDEEILPLIVLPYHVCTKLAGIRPVLHEATAEMREVGETYTYSWVQEGIDKRRADLVAALVTCRDTVSFACEECIRTVKSATTS